MSTLDPYIVLGLEIHASNADIRRAYKSRALIFHPDKPTGDVKRFQEIATAFSILGDPISRSLHDMSLTPSVFERPVREDKSPTAPQVIHINLEEMVMGGTRDLIITVTSTCGSCRGTGARDPHDFITCLACYGSGKQRAVSDQTAVFGSKSCNSCAGEGGCNISSQRCATCRGACRTKLHVQCVLTIPAGVQNGQVLKAFEVSKESDSKTNHQSSWACVARVEDSMFDETLLPLEEGVMMSVAFSKSAHDLTAVSVFVSLSLVEMLCGFERTIQVLGESVRFDRCVYDPALGDPSKINHRQNSENATVPFIIHILTRIMYPAKSLICPFTSVFKHILLPPVSSTRHLTSERSKMPTLAEMKRKNQGKASLVHGTLQAAELKGGSRG